MELLSAEPSESLAKALSRLNYFQALSKTVKQGDETYWAIHRMIDRYTGLIENCHRAIVVLNPRTNTWEL